MTPLHLEIDHIGILGPSIPALVREFRALGFAVVGPVELTAVDDSGKSIGLGQQSAHVMFADDYIELTAVDSTSPDHHLAQFLQPPWGIRLLLLTSDDIEESHDRCSQRHLKPSDVCTASRQLVYKQSAEARFKWFGLPAKEWPDILIAYVQHLTKELVFDKSVSQHSNGATGISRLYYCGDKLPSGYRQLADGGDHSIEVVTADREEAVLGFTPGRTTPFAGFGITVDDLRATSLFLRESGVNVRRANERISTQLQSGVCVIFEQAAAVR
ncbi:MAG: VOC family protein [Gammaproteobacteria bacterium]|nr:VOC family protein [Gammaproteobacteria bacterium]MDH3578111.1 VOC family protein [Gammaproteobacteria bacterium]